MLLTYAVADNADIQPVYQLCRQLIEDYENIESIAYDKVLNWVHKKIETSIQDYTVIYADGKKAGYYISLRMKMHNSRSMICMFSPNTRERVSAQP